uniref:Tubulin alpha chain n=2 Tax=Schistocephalus solidus TaxID=70667 RepID=A0A0X3PUU5_SCHSO
MREIVSLHIGQCGCQLGNAAWELYCAEHAITCEGQAYEPPRECENIDSFFSVTGTGQYVPRSIYIDLEATVIDEVRVGRWRKLFHPDKMISGCEDAANNFARGYFTTGKMMLGRVMNELRRTMENCDMPQGVMFFRSLSGGTGAGMTASILDMMNDYRKIPKIEIPVYPSAALSTAAVEPYNSILGEHFSMEDIDFALLLDNEAMYELCDRYMAVNIVPYSRINRMASVVVSSLTAALRFRSLLCGDLTTIRTNIVPYPRIHFPLANFSPIESPERADHDNISTLEITRRVFEKENQLVKVDPTSGMFMACTLLYRGAVSPNHVYASLNVVKDLKGVAFVDWCPTGFKVGITIEPPTSRLESGLAQRCRNVVMLANNTAVSQAWQRMVHKYFILYSKRAFVHWYVGEGMEESEFNEALINLTSLVKDYDEIVADPAEE